MKINLRIPVGDAILVVVICAGTFNFAAAADGADKTTMVARTLGDYVNADGTSPDGIANNVDDTAAMKAALGAGPGIVHIGPGHFRFGDVTIPSNVMVTGAGRATVIHANGENKTIFRQVDTHHWSLRDMVLDGGAARDWKEAKDLGQCGVLVHGSRDWEMSGLFVRNMNGAGIQMLSVYDAQPWTSKGTIMNVQAAGNYAGIRFDERAEFINASALGCWNNVIGCVIHGGNIKVTNSNFNSNLTGMLIEDKDNGSHGSITNCLLNHNHLHSLHCRNAENGMIVNACCFFYATMLIENSKGVNITSSQIGCNVTVAGEGVNRIAGNNLHVGKFTREFSPDTILQDNFTPDRSWERNRP